MEKEFRFNKNKSDDSIAALDLIEVEEVDLEAEEV